MLEDRTTGLHLSTMIVGLLGSRRRAEVKAATISVAPSSSGVDRSAGQSSVEQQAKYSDDVPFPVAAETKTVDVKTPPDPLAPIAPPPLFRKFPVALDRLVDQTIVKTYPEIECVVCNGLVIDAVYCDNGSSTQSACFHLACATCMPRLFEKSRGGHQTANCTCCHRVIQLTQMRIHGPTRQRVDELLVVCPFDGCGTQVKFGKGGQTLFEHAQFCKNREFLCNNEGCTAQLVGSKRLRPTRRFATADRYLVRPVWHDGQTSSIAT